MPYPWDIGRGITVILSKDFNQGNFIRNTVTYDCYIICCKDGFDADYLKVAKKIAASGIKYYFVRTFMDMALEGECEKLEKDLNKREKIGEDFKYVYTKEIEALKKKIRTDISKALASQNPPLPSTERQLFLISAFMSKVYTIDKRYDDRFEFANLRKEIVENMPKEKKNALIMTLMPITVEEIHKKCDSLREQIWGVSLLSGAVGAIPIPGTSLVIDLGILAEEMARYLKGLGLHRESLEKLGKLFGIAYGDIDRAVLSKFPMVNLLIQGLSNAGINLLRISVSELAKFVGELLVTQLLKYLSAYVSANAIEEVLKFVPIVGSIAGAGISFTTTLLALRGILSNFEECSVEILEYCKKNARL